MNIVALIDAFGRITTNAAEVVAIRVRVAKDRTEDRPFRFEADGRVPLPRLPSAFTSQPH